MPIQPTYPGVYIEELPSGVHTITGVATSITAFIGRAKRGTIMKAGTADVPEIINSYGDFERIFGGLSLDSTMSYAVRDFFLNGGSQAVIVRLAAGATLAKLSVAGLTLEAANEGSWGNNLVAAVDLNISDTVLSDLGIDPATGLTQSDFFNLTVQEVAPASGGQQKPRPVATEQFRNLTIVNSPRRADKVLAAGSKLAHWDSNNPLDTQANMDAVAAALTAAVAPLVAALATVKTDQQALYAAQHPAGGGPPNPAAVKAAQDALKLAKTALDAAATQINDQFKVTTPGSDGGPPTLNDFNPVAEEPQANKIGMYALERVDLFNILCIPPYVLGGDIDVSLVGLAAPYCEQRRAMLLVDSPSDWVDKSTAVDRFTDASNDYVGTRSKNAAIFFPRLKQPNPLRSNQVEEFVPCGAVAGIFARTDADRGVWKAPAGLDASLVGVPQLSVNLTDAENGELNPLGVNCLRAFPIYGRVVWGSRTLRGADQFADEYKYIPVRRTALFIEESLYRGTQWVVFEPNDEPLWAQIRLNVGAFMHNLFRLGAFQGQTPKDAYLVKCDHETTTQNDIDLGIVNILVAFAPLKPAEFVIIQIQQLAGQIQV